MSGRKWRAHRGGDVTSLAVCISRNTTTVVGDQSDVFGVRTAVRCLYESETRHVRYANERHIASYSTTTATQTYRHTQGERACTDACLYSSARRGGRGGGKITRVRTVRGLRLLKQSDICLSADYKRTLLADRVQAS